MALPAFAVPLIKAGGSLLLGKLFGGPSGTEKKVLESNLAAQKAGSDLSKQLIPQGQRMFDMARPAMQQPIDYWRNILSGNQSNVTSAMAPEISRIGQGYQQANQASAALSPRGGPSARFLSEQPYAQQRDVSNLMQQARPAAASSLFGAGESAQTAGSNLINNSIQAIYGATAAGRDVLNNEAQRRQSETSTGSALGGMLFEQLQGIDWGGIFGGGGGSNPRRRTVQTSNPSGYP